MNNDDKIKILMVAINGGGDFCWNLKSFPMALSNSNTSAYVLLYFKNPTKDDILKIVGKIADEFKEGFYPTCTDYNLRVRDKIYDVMLEHIDWNKEQEENFHDLYWNRGDYEINLRLIDYVKQEVEYVNTNEKEKLGMFDLESIDLI